MTESARILLILKSDSVFGNHSSAVKRAETFYVMSRTRLELGDHGSATWMGRTESYNVALFEIEVTAAKAPGDYLIVNEQTGQQNIISLGLSLDGRVTPIGRRSR